MAAYLPYISLISPYISLYLPVSPYISLWRARGDEGGRGVAQREAEVAVEVGRHRAARLVADVSRGYHPSYHARYYASWVEGVRLRAW